jgi:hypothetical protein
MFRSWTNVTIRDGVAFGIQSEQPYHPFELYCQWKDSRDSVVPPHLGFANLRRILQITDDDSMKAFLQYYGPLLTPQSTRIHDDGGSPSVSPENSSIGLQHEKSFPPRIGSSELAEGGLWAKMDVRSFWREQQKFRALYLLWLGTRGREEWSQLGECLAKVGAAQTDAKHEVLVAIASAINRRLGNPVVEPNGDVLDGSWDCDTLLEAMYTMFYWDIVRGRPVRTCANEVCERLFADGKGNVRFCRRECERTTRLRNWWRKNGKAYRQHKKQLDYDGSKPVDASDRQPDGALSQ